MKENIRYFKIETVASVVEVVALCKDKYIFDFCSYVLNKEVNAANIHIHRDEIINVINIDYPDMNRTIFLPDGYSLNKIEIEKIIYFYKTKYGNLIPIRQNIKDNSKKLIKTKD